MLITPLLLQATVATSWPRLVVIDAKAPGGVRAEKGLFWRPSASTVELSREMGSPFVALVVKSRNPGVPSVGVGQPGRATPCRTITPNTHALRGDNLWIAMVCGLRKHETVRVGWSEDPWKTVAILPRRSGRIRLGKGWLSYDVSNPREGLMAVRCSLPDAWYAKAYQLVPEVRDARKLVPAGGRDMGGRNPTWWFQVDSKSVKAVKLEVRDYHWLPPQRFTP